MDEQTNPKDNNPVKSSKNIWNLVIILIVVLLIGGGVYAWLKTDNQNTSSQNNSNPVGVQKEWKTYQNQEHGILLMYPNEWQTSSGDIDCASVNEFDSLKLIVFSTCAADNLGGETLTVEETFSRFKNAFLENGTSSSTNISDINVEVINYIDPGENGIYALTSNEGTVALWQGTNFSYALLDEDNQHQGNGYFNDILNSLKLDDSELIQ